MNRQQMHEYARFGAQSRLAAIDAEREELLASFPELRGGSRQDSGALCPLRSAAACPRRSGTRSARGCAPTGRSDGRRRPESSRPGPTEQLGRQQLRNVPPSARACPPRTGRRPANGCVRIGRRDAPRSRPADARELAGKPDARSNVSPPGRRAGHRMRGGRGRVLNTRR